MYFNSNNDFSLPRTDGLLYRVEITIYSYKFCYSRQELSAPYKAYIVTFVISHSLSTAKNDQ